MVRFSGALEMKTEARKYVTAFTNAVQPVIMQMSDGEEHVPRACSLLLILPPPPGAKFWIKSVPMSLAEIAMSEWIKWYRIWPHK